MQYGHTGYRYYEIAHDIGYPSFPTTQFLQEQSSCGALAPTSWNDQNGNLFMEHYEAI